MTSGPPPQTVVELMLQRAMQWSRGADLTGTIRTYTEILSHQGSTARQLSIAAYNRGCVRRQIEDDDGALGDWSWTIEELNPPRWILCRALIARGQVRSQFDDDCGAICDYTQAMALSTALGTRQEAISDARVAIHQHFSPYAMVGLARALRSDSRLELGDVEGAHGDAVTVTQMEAIPRGVTSHAFLSLSKCLPFTRRFEEAEAMARKSLRLEPVSGGVRCYIALALILRGLADEALEECRIGLAFVKRERTITHFIRLFMKLESQNRPIRRADEMLALLLEKRTQLESAPDNSPSHRLNRVNSRGL